MAYTHERQIYKNVGGSNDKNVPWFTKDVDDSNIGKAARELLETYSGIPAEQVLAHVLAIRDRAWAIHPYPCIGQLRFLDLSITTHALFNTLISRLQNSQTLLDLGCCFGQDIRALVAAGAPASNLYGADLRPEYTDLGYELFKDRDRIKAKFFSGDIFSDWARDEGKAFAKLRGNVDIIHAASLFHLFPLEDEKRLAHRLITLLRPVPGSLILGRQAGNVVAGDMASRSDSSRMAFRHNEDSWRELWQGVGRESGTRWKVESCLREVEGWSVGRGRAEGRGEGDRMMTFSVERI
ncbi:methyltransferase adrK [Physcia stellaris]|nr:methyltransferase adrK [Physcia stellaris]